MHDSARGSWTTENIVLETSNTSPQIHCIAPWCMPEVGIHSTCKLFGRKEMKGKVLRCWSFHMHCHLKHSASSYREEIVWSVGFLKIQILLMAPLMARGENFNSISTALSIWSKQRALTTLQLWRQKLISSALRYATHGTFVDRVSGYREAPVLYRHILARLPSVQLREGQ